MPGARPPIRRFWWRCGYMHDSGRDQCAPRGDFVCGTPGLHLAVWRGHAELPHPERPSGSSRGGARSSFTQMLQRLNEEGLVKFKAHAQDGMRVRAGASSGVQLGVCRGCCPSGHHRCGGGQHGQCKAQVEPMLDLVQARCGRLSKDWLMDGGFVTLSAVETADARGVRVLTPVPEPKDATRDRYAPLPDDSLAVAAWRERMGTAETRRCTSCVRPQRSVSTPKPAAVMGCIRCVCVDAPRCAV